MRSCRVSIGSESEEKRKMPILNDGQKKSMIRKRKGGVIGRKQGLRESKGEYGFESIHICTYD